MPRPDECLHPGEGTYLQRPSGNGAVTPVLLLGHGPRGIVLGAQADGGICQVISYARRLAARGYRVAAFEWAWVPADSTAAMTAATRALVGAGATHVVVGGFSRGAVVGLGAASRLGPEVVGVVSISGGPSVTEGYPTVRSVSTFPGPILLVMARGDQVFPPGSTQDIAAAHAGPEETLLLPGSDHALALLAAHRPAVDGAVDRFLERVLDRAG